MTGINNKSNNYPFWLLKSLLVGQHFSLLRFSLTHSVVSTQKSVFRWSYFTHPETEHRGLAYSELWGYEWMFVMISVRPLTYPVQVFVSLFVFLWYIGPSLLPCFFLFLWHEQKNAFGQFTWFVASGTCMFDTSLEQME